MPAPRHTARIAIAPTAEDAVPLRETVELAVGNRFIPEFPVLVDFYDATVSTFDCDLQQGGRESGNRGELSSASW